MADNTKEKVCWFKCDFPGFLEIWGFTLLGDLIATKKHFFPFGSFSIKDGSEIRFWEDKWLGNATLRVVAYLTVPRRRDPHEGEKK